jgi:hypothetical protein
MMDRMNILGVICVEVERENPGADMLSSRLAFIISDK